ncbi:MAG: RDD family protein [Candidatus Abyssobacteria bacterium SURF_5]|uniref:RDD family protein n=1 Tax=Abyssobacteria bacterium (strain SURF_5) TaxID=2093360 RepID=A0A3A4P8L6_ABYX5|nr:MAG: RDD family protein [Candidatus Abyssubacteria bacterium SURF_5]
MDWYYVENGQKAGPVSDEELQSMVTTGVITSKDLVWRRGMADWRPYGDVQNQTVALTEQRVFPCVECGKSFPADEMVAYSGSRVCAACKPIFFQRLQEGARLPATLRYAGFWIRFAAKFVDWFILGVVNAVIQLSFGFMVTPPQPGAMPSAGFFIGSVLMMIAQIGVAVFYATYFVGKFAATPGKMACGLKIVTPDGGKVSYWRACGRYFAEILSAMILLIGYIMAAFDSEKQALHDRICSTRVIRK